MKILFIHQNFPGQYKHIIAALAKSNGIQLVSLSTEKLIGNIPDNLQALQYSIERGNTPKIHPWALETESKIIRGEACARAAFELKEQGYSPDLICAHPGWGESLFLKAIWPNTPILNYQEFYYRDGFDLNFDPEIQGTTSWHKTAKSWMKNASLQLALEGSDWNVCPTAFQRSTFPGYWQQFISTIHDGINTNQVKPSSSALSLRLKDGFELSRNKQIVTFVNRTLEPYRGCHTMIRAIPELQRLCPEAELILVGETEGVSYGAACEDGEWKDVFLKEIEGHYDCSRVHFAGSLNYENYLKVLQVSKAHVYLTYPFVLSWSLMEAMSTECPIIGSSTEPVKELIQNGHNGLLVDFFDHHALANSITELINNRELAKTLGKNARRTILKDYSLEKCVPRHLALMDLVASGGLGRI